MIVDNGGIPDNILFVYVKEIVSHYDIVKIIYHNDLYEGNVMQIVYTIFIKRKYHSNNYELFILIILDK